MHQKNLIHDYLANYDYCFLSHLCFHFFRNVTDCHLNYKNNKRHVNLALSICRFHWFYLLHSASMRIVLPYNQFEYAYFFAFISRCFCTLWIFCFRLYQVLLLIKDDLKNRFVDCCVLGRLMRRGFWLFWYLDFHWRNSINLYHSFYFKNQFIFYDWACFSLYAFKI